MVLPEESVFVRGTGATPVEENDWTRLAARSRKAERNFILDLTFTLGYYYNRVEQ